MQSQAQFAVVPMNGGAPMQHSPPPAPLYNPTQYQYANGAMQHPQMSADLMMAGRNGMVRYPIPPHPMPAGQMAGGRQKKEIRRRTKTGCLTCRKRRCDEGHPTCRNCQKSKRECLGYDPIFKPQTGHANIQPAPVTTSIPNSNPIPPPTPTTHQQSQAYPGTGGTFIPTPNHPQAVDGAAEYRPSLDPALATGAQPLNMASNSFSTTLHPTRQVKPITMEQLFSLNDVAPIFQWREAPPPNTTVQQAEIEDFYRFHFAQGLDKLFETIWYSSQGMAHILQNPPLLDFVGQCVEQFQSQDPAAVHAIQSLEARLVWQLAIMPRNVSHASIANNLPTDQAILDVLPRIDIVEHLLTGQHLPHDRVPRPPSASTRNDALEYNKQNFWHQLGTFTSQPDDSPDPLVTHAINEALNTMRGILGIMENRDVLYSLAITRYIGGRMVEFHPRQPLVTSGDPNDEVAKLEVARRHVDIEDQKGTTQVIQRICGMAIRAGILQKR